MRSVTKEGIKSNYTFQFSVCIGQTRAVALKLHSELSCLVHNNPELQ